MDTNDRPRLLYRMPEAADALGISRAKCYELAARGVIPTIRVDGSIRVPVEALREWIERQVGESSASVTDANVVERIDSD